MINEVSPAYELARFVLEFISIVKCGDIDWQKQKLEEISQLKRQKRINDAKLEHELNMLQQHFTEEIKREQEKERRITEDYKHFLDSIDEMKHKMLETFTDIPKPMVYVIHHHAKQLLDDMWKTNDKTAKEISTKKFTDFLITVYDDTAKAIADKEQAKLPNNTLKLLGGRQGC